jgi:hypothetical protein
MRKGEEKRKNGFLLSISMVVNAHSRKLEPRIFSTEAGRQMDLRKSHPKNAKSAISRGFDPDSNPTNSTRE